jgi:hypothetical protein
MHVTPRQCQLTLPRGTLPRGADEFPKAGTRSQRQGSVPQAAELFPVMRTRSARRGTVPEGWEAFLEAMFVCIEAMSIDIEAMHAAQCQKKRDL